MSVLNVPGLAGTGAHGAVAPTSSRSHSSPSARCSAETATTSSPASAGTRSRPLASGPVRWHRPARCTHLDGALTWIDCNVLAVHEAGDHYIAIGRVQSLGETTAAAPLLFYRGTYAGLSPTPESPPTDLDAFLTTIHPDDWL
ncbi:flavin reductase family protein [Saccharopolyspora spinosa]|uniref:flavin reductase family protein n=1 Tax=Saccharopolyspora spinosa TaxID=60894 RepID=UPI001ED97875|nr:flavin reductase family protein [Saccharopolyspora spinosa]